MSRGSTNYLVGYVLTLAQTYSQVVDVAAEIQKIRIAEWLLLLIPHVAVC